MRDEDDITFEQHYSWEVPTTLDEVEASVETLRRSAAEVGDAEALHAAEDQLHREVLASIALGLAEDPAGMCRAALQTIKLEFSRWYA